MYYTNTTPTLKATLTKFGKQLLADDSASFKVTQYRFSDDEIDYSQFIDDGNDSDSTEVDIASTPILEACTFGNVPSQRYGLLNLPLGTTKVSRLDSDWILPFVNGMQETRPAPYRFGKIISLQNGPFRFAIRTYYGNDTTYFCNTSNEEIVSITSNAVRGADNCTDPYATLQQQSEVGYEFSLASGILNGTQVVNITPITVGGIKNGIQPYLQAQMKAIPRTLNSANTRIFNSGLGPINLMGMCGCTLTIEGKITGSKTYIDILFYNPGIWEIKNTDTPPAGDPVSEAPTITSFTPQTSIESDGTVVTIIGKNFGSTQGIATIKFGVTYATPTSWSDTQIVVPVPLGIIGLQTITITKSLGYGQWINSATQFEIKEKPPVDPPPPEPEPDPEITDFSPKSGHSQTGNRPGESERRINLTITGVGFGNTRGGVWFGDSRGNMAQFAKMANDSVTHMEWSNTKIVVEVPTTLSDDETIGYKAEYPIFVYPFGSGNDNPLISATTFHCNG